MIVNMLNKEMTSSFIFIRIYIIRIYLHLYLRQKNMLNTFAITRHICVTLLITHICVQVDY